VLGDLGLDVAKLPELHRGVDVVGRITAQAAGQTGLPQGTPVVAGGGDGACATLGAGVAAPGCAYCCMGSTAWIACATQEPYIDEHARVFNILNMDGETNGVYGTVQAAGSSLEWIREVFGGIEFQEMEAAARQADPGSGKLVFLPYLEGERSPIWDSHARGVFFGLSPMHGRARMVRAVVEGVCYALRSVLDVFREDYDLDELRIIGGGARSELWRQTLADVCRARLHTLTAPSEHGTALGAALTAGVGVGIFSSLTEAAGQIAERETVVPDGERSAVYEPLYDFYLSLYPEMKDAFARLEALGA
jgi:xylulokinase